MSDVLTAAQRSYCMSQNKGTDTKPEVTLRKALWHLGVRYRIRSKLPGKPDIVFPRWSSGERSSEGTECETSRSTRNFQMQAGESSAFGSTT
jgi:hypothetical protein